MGDKEIRQLFKNNFDCYADADNVIMAMTEDRFLEVIKQALYKSCVSGRSEQLSDFLNWFRNAIGTCDIHSESEVVIEYIKSLNCH